MSLSSCHCKHRPAFVCIRSLCKHWEGCGVLLQKAAQARALSGRVGNGYGWSLFLETDGLLRCQDDTVLPPASLQALQRVSAITLCAQQHSSQYRPGGWAEHLINSVSFWLQRQLPAQELRGIVKVVAEEISPFKRKNKNLGKTFLLPPHFSWAHTGAVGGSKSSSAPQEQGYCRVIFLKLHQGREAGAGNWACGGQRISQHGHCQEDPGCRALLQLIFAAWRRRRIPQKDSSTLASGC